MTNLLLALQAITSTLIWLQVRELVKTQNQIKKENDEKEFIENFVTQDSSVISDHVFEREKEYDKMIADLKKELYTTDEAKPVKGLTYNIPHDEVDKKIFDATFPDVEYAD
jgi:hypothetical protein